MSDTSTAEVRDARSRYYRPHAGPVAGEGYPSLAYAYREIVRGLPCCL